jgi:predicted SnoaL-like aldol condensation-catalyzing enzyme
VGDGKQAGEYFTRMAREYPGQRVHFKRVIAGGGFPRLTLPTGMAGDSAWAGIDIFRMDDSGKIMEHWDVLQRVPGSSASENSMFYQLLF